MYRVEYYCTPYSVDTVPYCGVYPLQVALWRYDALDRPPSAQHRPFGIFHSKIGEDYHLGMAESWH